MSTTRYLLRRLAAHDEVYLQAVLAPRSRLGRMVTHPPALDQMVRALVELAALLAADAATASLRCAVEQAAANGADDHTLVHVLETAAGPAGAAQTVKSASRLALALDFDVEPERVSRADRPRMPEPPPPSVTRLQAFDTRRAPAS